MKERPILYSAPMVLAKLAGRKTQTRRVAKFQFLEGQNPDFSGYTAGTYMTGGTPGVWVLRSRGRGACWNDRTDPLNCPYGGPGDRLWGRETFGISDDREDIDMARALKDAKEQMPWASVIYRADANSSHALSHLVDGRWRPSIFMPRWASRLLDEVVSVRIERLGDISEADAIAEGLISKPSIVTGQTMWSWPTATHWFARAREAYLAGWDTINGKGAAAKNPWVWRVETRPVR